MSREVFRAQTLYCHHCDFAAIQDVCLNLDTVWHTGEECQAINGGMYRVAYKLNLLGIVDWGWRWWIREEGGKLLGPFRDKPLL